MQSPFRIPLGTGNVQAMAGVEKRYTKGGDARWRVHWREEGQTQSQTFLTRDAARTFQIAVEANGNRWPPRYTPGRGWDEDDPNPSGHTVRSAALRRIEFAEKASDGTKADYRRELDRYLPEDDPLAGIFVEAVTLEDILEWRARLAGRRVQLGGPPRRRRAPSEPPPTPPPMRTLSAKTRRNAHSLVSGGLDLMVAMGHISVNPAKGWAPTGSEGGRGGVLTPDQFRALLEYIPRHYKPFVEALGRTGMRFGEITALRVGDILFDREPPEIHLTKAWKRTPTFGRYELGTPKSRAGERFIPVDEHLTTLLRAAVRNRRRLDFVFTTETGVVIRHNNFSTRVWRPAVKKAYEDGAISFEATIHDLRHAHGSWLLANGVPVNSVADRLGHDAAVLLRVYAHVLDQSRILAATRMGEILPAIDISDEDEESD